MAQQKTTGRRVGRPKRSDRVIGPAELVVIARMYLSNTPIAKIAESFGVHHSAIHHHLDHTLRPLWNLSVMHAVEVELAKIDELERIAWIKLEESFVPETTETVKEALSEGGANPELVKRVVKRVNRISTAWAEVIMACIAERSRLKGFYAADRFKINCGDHGGSIRVAGKTREDLDQILRDRVEEVLRGARERKRLLGPSRG
jgi:hypothetical protein